MFPAESGNEVSNGVHAEVYDLASIEASDDSDASTSKKNAVYHQTLSEASSDEDSLMLTTANTSAEDVAPSEAGSH